MPNKMSKLELFIGIIEQDDKHDSITITLDYEHKSVDLDTTFKWMEIQFKYVAKFIELLQKANEMIKLKDKERE